MLHIVKLRVKADTIGSVCRQQIVAITISRLIVAIRELIGVANAASIAPKLIRSTQLLRHELHATSIQCIHYLLHGLIFFSVCNKNSILQDDKQGKQSEEEQKRSENENQVL